VFRLALFAVAVSAGSACAADVKTPVACVGDAPCRAVEQACAVQYRSNDCSDLQPAPGVVLTPRDACYVNAARKRCSRFDHALASCLLQGHPGIAGGCWHLSPAFENDMVEIDGQRFECERFSHESLACETIPAAQRK
jgi:hypothetical protein